MELLQHVLQDERLDSVLVFTNTKHGADRVVKELGRAGVAAMAIHGNKGQTARIRALDSFKSGAIRVLVATDIAARGIDIDQLPFVFNYNLPDVPETYVHRIGRTGRAKRQGVAVSLIADYPSKMRIDDIAQKTRNEIVPVKFGENGALEVIQ